MPELPEVETLCRQLNKILPGEEILAVEAFDPRLGNVPPLAGNRIVSVQPPGKIYPDRDGKRPDGSAPSPDDRPSPLADRRCARPSPHAADHHLCHREACPDRSAAIRHLLRAAEGCRSGTSGESAGGVSGTPPPQDRRNATAPGEILSHGSALHCRNREHLCLRDPLSRRPWIRGGRRAA